MADEDIVAERGRALEEEYFRRRTRSCSRRCGARRYPPQRVEMGQRTGLTDPELLQALETVGFTPETVVLLPLMPEVHMAWAEGP